MDAIANAISDSCEPAILQDIYMQTIDERTIIVVEISVGRQRPYFIKSPGRDQGTYVRVAGTSRHADEEMILELLFEGRNRHYDQTACVGQSVTVQEIEELCRLMKEVALTNAYEVLTGRNETVIQCGVFKGKTKAVFVDRREYDGPIWDQIEEAYQFVLRNIHLGALFSGIYRQDVYEIPPMAIRELIINAAVHRSYIDHGNIQVAVYDDRLEVLSPGKLAMGQTMEKMLQGRSVIRNEALAYAFAYMNLIEHWGSGIPRIVHEVGEMGLPDPVFEDGDTYICADIYRKNDGDSDGNAIAIKDSSDGDATVIKGNSDGDATVIKDNSDGDATEKCDNNDINASMNGEKWAELGLNEVQLKILYLLNENSRTSTAKLAEDIGITKRNVEKNIEKLKARGLIIHHGVCEDRLLGSCVVISFK